MSVKAIKAGYYNKKSTGISLRTTTILQTKENKVINASKNESRKDTSKINSNAQNRGMARKLGSSASVPKKSNLRSNNENSGINKVVKLTASTAATIHGHGETMVSLTSATEDKKTAYRTWTFR